MEVNLRKGKALQDAIRNEIGTLQNNMSNTKKVDIYDENLLGTAKRHYDEVSLTYKKVNELREALFEIRRKTKSANATSGIEDLLASVAEAEMASAFYREVIEQGERTPEAAIEKRAEVERNNNTNGHNTYGSTTSVTISGVEASVLEHAKARLAANKRQLIDIKDDLVGKNVTTKIVLSDKTVDTLTAMGII